MKAKQANIDQYVIDKVKEKRETKGMTQEDLAFELGVSVGFIGNVESPKYRAKYNLTHINKLAIILSCSPRDFLPKDAIK